MSYIYWKDEYSVGIKLFDDQHKNMFGFINDLNDAIAGVEEHAVLRRILKDLIDYTKTHFRDEEQNLKKYDYPGYSEHKAEHRRLSDEVMEFALARTSLRR